MSTHRYQIKTSICNLIHKPTHEKEGERVIEETQALTAVGNSVALRWRWWPPASHILLQVTATEPARECGSSDNRSQIYSYIFFQSFMS